MDLAGMVRASSVAEVAWVGLDGMPRVAGVMALTQQRVPVVALTYARAELARALAGAGPSGAQAEVVLTLTEPRSTGRKFTPVALSGRAVLQEDPDGRIYREELIVQELHRYPPARVLADSPLLCRENWWFLPRLIVALPEAEPVPLPARHGPQEHLLVTGQGGRPVVTVVGLPASMPAEGEHLELDLLGGQDPRPGPATVFGQDASFPDLERWQQWWWEGRLDTVGQGRARMAVTRAPAQVGLPEPPGVMQRWRDQRALERACRQGLRAWPSTHGTGAARR